MLMSQEGAENESLGELFQDSMGCQPPGRKNTREKRGGGGVNLGCP